MSRFHSLFYIPLQTIVTSSSPVFRDKSKGERSAGEDCCSFFYYVAAHFASTGANYIYETLGPSIRNT